MNDVKVNRPAPVRRIDDLDYTGDGKVDGVGGEVSRGIDLFLPAKGAADRLVVFLPSRTAGLMTEDADEHPGGHVLDGLAALLAGDGIALANLRYRPVGAFSHPTQIDDIATGIAWLDANAALHGVDARQMIVAGVSVGAYFAALLASDPDRLRAAGGDPQAIAATIAISGVYDLAHTVEPMRTLMAVDTTFGGDSAALDAASPVRRDESDPSPLMLSYTDHDLFGADEHAKAFYSRLLARKLPVELVVVPDRTHFNQIAGIGRAMPRPDRSFPPAGAGVDLPVPEPVEVCDVLGPAILRFIRHVGDGTLARSFAAAWPEGIPVKGMNDEYIMSPPPPMPALVTRRDIAFGDDARLQSLDLYMPENDGGGLVPAMLYLHGGGWQMGDKAMIHGLRETFGRLGMAVAAANYRLAPAAKFPANIEDAASAFAHLHRNAEAYGIDRDRIVVLGISSGAHLAALLGLDPSYLAHHKISAAAIKGILAIAGDYAIPRVEPGEVPTRVAATFNDDPETHRAGSPIRFVHAGAPPFLISFSDSDLHTKKAQAEAFYAAFVALNLDAELVYVPGRTHFDQVVGFGRKVAGIDDVLGPQVIEFLFARGLLGESRP